MVRMRSPVQARQVAYQEVSSDTSFLFARYIIYDILGNRKKSHLLRDSSMRKSYFSFFNSFKMSCNKSFSLGPAGGAGGLIKSLP